MTEIMKNCVLYRLEQFDNGSAAVYANKEKTAFQTQFRLYDKARIKSTTYTSSIKTTVRAATEAALDILNKSVPLKPGEKSHFYVSRKNIEIKIQD